VSLASSSGETAPHLEGVVNDPLHAGKGTHHEDSGAEALPQTVEADLSVDVSDLLASWLVGVPLVDDGDHGVSGVGHDGTEHSCDVAGHESDRQLSALAVLVLGLGEDALVELGHDLLEGDELHDGVRHLSAPQRVDALEEAVRALSRVDVVVSSHE